MICRALTTPTGERHSNLIAAPTVIKSIHRDYYVLTVNE